MKKEVYENLANKQIESCLSTFCVDLCLTEFLHSFKGRQKHTKF